MKTLRINKQYYGAILWIFSIQYYFVQLITALTWTGRGGYSWANHTISDLGNTQCGFYGERVVCSPLNPLMNASFILLGITMILGAIMFIKQLKTKGMVSLGFYSMVVAGIGAILVGLSPENTNSVVHVLGAALSFMFGNLGMLYIGLYSDKMPKQLRIFSVISGAIGIIALMFFVLGQFLGLGIGGMERLTGYPQSIWMIVFGLCALKELLSTRTKEQNA